MREVRHCQGGESTLALPSDLGYIAVLLLVAALVAVLCSRPAVAADATAPRSTSAAPATTCTVSQVAIFDDWRLTTINVVTTRARFKDAIGHFHLTLLCGIKSGSLDLRLQRHDFTGWNRTHTRRLFAWHSKDTVTLDLAGRKSGYSHTMKVEAMCTGTANWRLRLFASPGEAADGKFIKPETDYFPDSDGDVSTDPATLGLKFKCPVEQG